MVEVLSDHNQQNQGFVSFGPGKQTYIMMFLSCRLCCDPRVVEAGSLDGGRGAWIRCC